MRKHCLIFFLLLIFLTGCGPSNEEQAAIIPTAIMATENKWTRTPIQTLTPTPLPTNTPSATPTIRIVEITRVIRETVIVTATPTPFPAEECFETAMTQGEMNSCAVSRRDFAIEELEKLLTEVNLQPDDKKILEKMVVDWLETTYNDCDFFYGKLIEDEYGLHYEWGSMAPLQRAICEALRIEQLVREINDAYFFE